ncbi:MAG: transcriptional repressor LexA [Pigmentiphaga sp.]|nr:transcriptional repressor LexA [Pigmentiphaga sp.]
MRQALTARQEQILHTIREFIQRTGIPPTRAELARELGFRSANAAEDHLRALARKGAIELSAGTSRGIRLLDADAPPATATAASSGPDAPPAAAARATAAAAGVRAAKAAGASVAQGLEVLANRIALPLVGRVAAGQPILAAEHVSRQVEVDPELFSESPDYLLTVRGLSMRDAGILEGDLVAVRRTPEAHPGRIVVARLADEVTVKRLAKARGGWQLLPENPDYEPIAVQAGDDFQIEGVVVGLIRPGPRW